MVTQSGDEAKLPVHEISERDFVAALDQARTNMWPTHWPENVRVISLDGLSLIGLDDKGHIYLDGKRLYTERRFAWQERAIAWIVALATMGGAVAGGVSAWLDWQSASASAPIASRESHSAKDDRATKSLGVGRAP